MLNFAELYFNLMDLYSIINKFNSATFHVPILQKVSFNFADLFELFRNMHNVTNMFICSVSFADFILIILATPFQAKVTRNPYSIYRQGTPVAYIVKEPL